jgi:hypothetical protein
MPKNVVGILTGKKEIYVVYHTATKGRRRNQMERMRRK